MRPARAQCLGHGRGQTGPLEQLPLLQFAVRRDHHPPLRREIVAFRGERDRGGLDPYSTFSGRGLSGRGYELGPESIGEYTATKTIKTAVGV